MIAITQTYLFSGVKQFCLKEMHQFIIILPLISMSCSSETGSPLMGSVPFSAIYFSISRLSNTQLDDGETHGCSGTSLLTIQKIL